MSITWRIKVYDEGFTSRTQPGKANNILTPADAFASLDSFDVEGSGNCLEARFRCVPSLVDIRPRDVIELEVSEDGGSSYTRVYRGYIVVAGNARSTEIEAYKAVGLKQRFYEKVNPLSEIDGADIATMASDVHSEMITDSYLPGGVAALSADAPTLGLVLGDRYPQLETVGATYDYFAEQAGAFIVASGTTYTYDGVTYAAGDTVPAVQWGVDADGNFFFKRWQRDALVAAEDDTDKLVSYKEISGETKFDSVQLIYATDPEQNIFQVGVGKSTRFQVTRFVEDEYQFTDFTWEPLSRRFDIDGNNATRVVAADLPFTIMSDVAASASASGTVTNESNVLDGDDSTYATVTNGTVSVTRPFFASFVARLKFETTSATNSIKVYDNFHEWRSENMPDTSTYDVYLSFVLPFGASLPSLLITQMARWRVAGENIRVYTMESLVPDVDDGGTSDEEYAERFLRSVNTNVAEVSQFGSLGAVSQTMTFTPSGESAVDVPVERVSYRLSTREGLVTTYHLGQAYDAELLSERAVLEALAQRVAS